MCVYFYYFFGFLFQILLSPTGFTFKWKRRYFPVITESGGFRDAVSRIDERCVPYRAAQLSAFALKTKIPQKFNHFNLARLPRNNPFTHLRTKYYYCIYYIIYLVQLYIVQWQGSKLMVCKVEGHTQHLFNNLPTYDDIDDLCGLGSSVGS